MKKVMVICLMAMLVSGCTSSTEFGQCIGAFDDKKPNLIYKASKWNIFLGIIFSGLIIPPIFVIVDETLCPVGIKE